MEVNKIKIGEKCRVFGSEYKELNGCVGEVVELIKTPINSFVKIKFNDNNVKSLSPSALAPILSTKKYKECCNVFKKVNKIEDILLDVIESILVLLKKDFSIDDYEFDFINNVVNVCGEYHWGDHDSCSFPLKYLYEENWYEDMIKEQEEEKRKKEELKQKRLEEESKIAEKRKEERDKKEYLRLKAKFENSDS